MACSSPAWCTHGHTLNFTVKCSLGLFINCGPDGGGWRMADRKMRMIKCGWKDADDKMRMTKSVGKEINYNHNGSK